MIAHDPAGEPALTGDAVQRVDLTEEAAALLRTLAAEHGPLMFHQSGGCCDGSSPMCYPLGGFIVSEADVQLGGLPLGGGLPDVPVSMSRAQFAYWRHTHLTLDVVPGRGAGFSLEAPTGHRFLIRSRLLDGCHPSGFVTPPTPTGIPTCGRGWHELRSSYRPAHGRR